MNYFYIITVPSETIVKMKSDDLTRLHRILTRLKGRVVKWEEFVALDRDQRSVHITAKSDDWVTKRAIALLITFLKSFNER